MEQLNTNYSLRFLSIILLFSPLLCDQKLIPHCKQYVKGERKSCLECETSFFITPDKTKPNIFICGACHETCGECRGNLANDCTSCPERHYLKKNKGNDKGVCASCTEGCLVCNSNDFCVICEENYKMNNRYCEKKQDTWLFLVVLGFTIVTVILLSVLFGLKRMNDRKNRIRTAGEYNSI